MIGRNDNVWNARILVHTVRFSFLAIDFVSIVDGGY